MRPWFPETGPRGGRYRIERMRCPCGVWHDGRVYEAKDPAMAKAHPLGVASPMCVACRRVAVRAIKRRSREARPDYKACRGCGAKHAVENANEYCAVCRATWRCRDCGRNDRPRDSHNRCKTCAKREERVAKPLRPRTVTRFRNLFGALLSEHCDRVAEAEAREAAEATQWTPEVAREAVAVLRRYRGRGRPSALTFPVVLTRTGRAPLRYRRTA